VVYVVAFTEVDEAEFVTVIDAYTGETILREDYMSQKLRPKNARDTVLAHYK